MKIIGISGRIGAGKSILANYLAGKGGVNLEVDEIGHKMLADRDIQEKLVDTFGQTIIENGKISRKELGKIAFASVDNTIKLNSIMHPAMTKIVKQNIKSEMLLNKPFVLINAALLFSMGLDRLCDVIIYVDSGADTRLNRLLKYRRMPKDKAEIRLFAQDAIPKNNAKIIRITNNSTIADLYSRADKLYDDVVA